MNQLVSHIEFLLHTHNCVIVPSLGGFVVNTTATQKDGISVFHAPMCELVFNRDLSHNDGLLVESYMRTEDISFEAASQKIEDAVREIKNRLREHKIVDLGDLGRFQMTDDQRFMYIAKPFIRPEHFGLTAASLKPIIQLKPKATVVEQTNETRKSVVRKIGIGAAAAAVIAAIMLFFPIQDSTLRHQTAQIISESGLFSGKTEKAPATSSPSISTETTTTETPEIATNATDTQVEAMSQTSDTPRFYIVTGVYEVRKVADDMLALLQSEGFSSASSIERSNRIDVYASSFSSREEAEQNLRQLKKDFPNHRDAWILKR